MLAHIDFQNRSANILSIPRDTLVSIPGYKRKRRINAANALGGPELAQATITDFLGVSPDYYMLTNFQGFAKAIDDIGGVTINVDKQLDYDDNWGQLHIHLKPGVQHLNGEQAMGFVRYRHSNKGGGDSDFVRIARQQALLTAVKSKIANPGVLVRVPRVLDGIREDVDSNLTTSQMVCLARFMKSLPKGDSVHMETIPTAEGSRIYVKADLDATRELVSRMFRDSQQ
jgi:LCP family protein required for cell wall assembly